MRLLKTGPYIPGAAKLELIEKWGVDIPPYAILSHTWASNADDEVLFADVQDGKSHLKAAYPKLEQAMERAKLDGYGWLWIDTCCINKTSSVELSEAINSMYSYYKNAQKCYAYMVDVAAATLEADFPKSRWWRRGPLGWTLQELISPRCLEFYSAEWISLGFKEHLQPAISRITGIESGYLRLTLPVEHGSVAKRMSWASHRKTTREEDLAYCLIGIFDITMPMLYGEGRKRAFHRLQEEIMRANEDQSLFAWIKTEDDGTTVDGMHGLLADSPSDFQHTGFVIPYSALADYSVTTITARGLNITLPLTPKADGRVVAALRCPAQNRAYSSWLALYLQKLSTGSNVYARVDCANLASVAELGKPQQLYVRQPPSFALHTVYPHHYFSIRRLDVSSGFDELRGYTIAAVVDESGSKGKIPNHVVSAPKRVLMAQPQTWSRVPLVYEIDKTEGVVTVALLLTRSYDGASFKLLLGAGQSFTFAFDVQESDSQQSQSSTIAEDVDSFRPQPPGQPMVLEYHTVRVLTEEIVRSEEKIYFLDIEVVARPLPPKTSDIMDNAIGALDVFHKPGVERRAAKSAFFEKVKRRVMN